MAMRLTVSYTQHRGNNAYPQQDALWMGERSIQSIDLKPERIQLDTEDCFLAVADGVAVSPAPHLCSRFVVEAIAEERMASIECSGSWRLDGAALRRVHGRLCDRYGKGKSRGSSTTLAAVQLMAGRGVALNVGDSRIYRISAGGEWRQLSRDHTVLQTMIDEGRADPEINYASLYGALDACLIADDEEDGFSIHFVSFNWEVGDKLLLCTDGVHDVIGVEDLKDLFERNNGEPVAGWRREVLAAGAPDNFSMVFVCRDF